MCETYENEVENLSYKTIRYPGHLNHMKFLFNDLHLKKNKDVLEKLFDKEVPRTKNDVIIFFVKVIGLIDGVLQEKTYLKRKIYGDEKFQRNSINNCVRSLQRLASSNKSQFHGKIL
jgi:saccharopine dehydrogenase-like NADP-dependent oxidoreductase